ncbi:unnamed protein product, partial [marine sediment metagenome]
MEELDLYLQPTEFLNFNRKYVREKAVEITKDLKTEKEKSTALFYWVRDEIKYNMFAYYPKIKANLKASVTMRRKYGFCMSKAVLLSTMARAIGIPARIHMVDIINHKISQRVVDMMGTKAFHCHAYSEMMLNGKCVKIITELENVCTTFDVCSAGSKIETNFPEIGPSTNHPYCPTLRSKLSLDEFKVPDGVFSIPEIVFNALDIESVKEAMKKSIQGIIDMDGLIKISSGNYGGKLGKYKIMLRELGLK